MLDDIQDHLLCDGIKKNYPTWICHGELTNMQMEPQFEPFDVQIGDRLENMTRDLEKESFQEVHALCMIHCKLIQRSLCIWGARIP